MSDVDHGPGSFDHARPHFLFAPGAGAPSSSPWMTAWATRLATLGPVTPFDYPYMRARRKRPDRQPGLVAAHREALVALADEAAARAPGRAPSASAPSAPAAAPLPPPPIFLIGKSMGSRMGCHLAVELHDGQTAASPSPAAPAPAVAGLVCLGYPLVAGATGAMRDQVLLALRLPILFVQGTRDPLCPLPVLESVLARMTAPHRLHVVEGGNHSLELPAAKRTPAARAQAQSDSDAAVLAAIRAFVDDVLVGRLPAAD